MVAIIATIVEKNHHFVSADAGQLACINCLKYEKSIYCPTHDFKKGQCEPDPNLQADLLRQPTSALEYCSHKMDESTRNKQRMKRFSCPTIDKCHINGQERLQKVTHKEFRTYQLQQDNLFGNSELCNYELEFPDDAQHGDRLKLQITRLQGATIYVGLGSDYDKQLHIYSYTNTKSNVQRDPGEYENAISAIYPFKIFISVQSTASCCSEFKINAIIEKKRKISYDIQEYINDYNNQIQGQMQDKISDDTFLLIAWIIIGLQFLIIFAVAAYICHYVRLYTIKSDELNELQKKQDMSQLHLLEQSRINNERRSNQKFLSPNQQTARRGQNGPNDLDDLAIAALTEEIDRQHALKNVSAIQKSKNGGGGPLVIDDGMLWEQRQIMDQIQRETIIEDRKKLN